MSQIHMSPMQRLNLHCFVPPNSVISYIGKRVSNFIALRSDDKLLSHVKDCDENVLVVFLFGHGDEYGFYCSSETKSLTEPVRILPEWWDLSGLARNVQTYLFALVCNSYFHLAGSEMRNYLKGAIGFDDQIMMSLDKSDVDFWIWFFKKLYVQLEARSKIDHKTYISIESLYKKHYSRNHTGLVALLRALCGRRLSYLTRLCLVNQLEAMKLAI